MGNLHGGTWHLSTQSVKFEHHDVVSLGMFGDKSCDQAPLEWMNQALITREEATKPYMMERIAESDF